MLLLLMIMLMLLMMLLLMIMMMLLLAMLVWCVVDLCGAQNVPCLLQKGGGQAGRPRQVYTGGNRRGQIIVLKGSRKTLLPTADCSAV